MDSEGVRMKQVSFKKEVRGDFNRVIEDVTAALKDEGFGILTRIDLHEKFKEKLGKEIEPVVILGACNPKLAYDSYQASTDVTSLLPCNAVVRQLTPGTCSIELARATALMEILGDPGLVKLANEADERLERCLMRLTDESAAA